MSLFDEIEQRRKKQEQQEQSEPCTFAPNAFIQNLYRKTYKEGEDVVKEVKDILDSLQAGKGNLLQRIKLEKDKLMNYHFIKKDDLIKYIIPLPFADKSSIRIDVDSDKQLITLKGKNQYPEDLYEEFEDQLKDSFEFEIKTPKQLEIKESDVNAKFEYNHLIITIQLPQSNNFSIKIS